jgi:UDP-N-acetylglucosamine 4-epimerase
MIRDILAVKLPSIKEYQPVYREFREGDVRHSLADISKAQRLLGYGPSHRVQEGLKEAMDWYTEDLLDLESSNLNQGPIPALRG